MEVATKLEILRGGIWNKLGEHGSDPVIGDSITNTLLDSSPDDLLQLSVIEMKDIFRILANFCSLGDQALFESKIAEIREKYEEEHRVREQTTRPKSVLSSANLFQLGQTSEKEGCILEDEDSYGQAGHRNIPTAIGETTPTKIYNLLKQGAGGVAGRVRSTSGSVINYSQSGVDALSDASSPSPWSSSLPFRSKSGLLLNSRSKRTGFHGPDSVEANVSPKLMADSPKGRGPKGFKRGKVIMRFRTDEVGLGKDLAEAMNSSQRDNVPDGLVTCIQHF